MELGLRRGLLLLVAATAVVAVLAGLARLGVAVPGGAGHALEHGPAFVLGVFGTVIALERAVALGQRWALLAPLLAAVTAGVLVMRGGTPAPALVVGSALALVAVNVAIVRRQVAVATVLMLVGALLRVAADLAWARGRPVFEVVPGWMGFFVVTILAERLELSRLAPCPRWARPVVAALAVALAAVISVGLAVGATWPRLVGALVLALAVWELRFDLARRTVARPGLPRFAALGVLAGAAWLALAGVLLVRHGLPPAGPMYDAILHAIFVGFVLSMVFAHAPIILPAVARTAVPYHPALLVPLAALHLGLSARVIGDLTFDAELRRGGALASALALGLFAATVVWTRFSRRAC